jgi:PAS domain S-box-containing protein
MRREAPRRRRVPSWLGIGLGIALGYYAGAQLGLLLRASPLAPAVLWPPVAVLTTALLLVRPRRWWLCLLAAAVAHVSIHRDLGEPVALVGALFAAHGIEALIVALVVRRAGLAPPALFESLRGIVIFIVAAGFLAPLSATLAEAAAGTVLVGADPWSAWPGRCFAHALTALTLVPPLALGLIQGRTWLARATRRRVLEAVALWGGLALVLAVVVLEPPVVTLVLAFALVVSFLVWAAVRFGPAGASLSLLSVELIAAWGTAAGLWPLDDLAPGQGVLPQQLFLLGTAIPLLGLAALIEERRRARTALEERLRFEGMLSRLSRAFVHLPSHDVDRTIDLWLQQLGEHLQCDHVAIFQLAEADRMMVPTHAWIAPGAARRPRRLESAVTEGLHDSPLMITDFGVLSFGARSNGLPWPEAMIPQLRLVAEVFGNAITRQRAEEALRASEVMKAAILDSLTSGMAVLDRKGEVVAVNKAWRRLGREWGAGDGIAIGATAGEICAYAMEPSSPQADEAAAAIDEVAQGRRADFSVAYPRPAAGEERWFALSVLPLNRPEGGAVVSLSDITPRKRMELEAQQTREELAHAARVATIGELTASLTHELSQPLTGILTNAQAAQRLLAMTPANLEEVGASLADIVADDRRAADIIRRLRELFKKGQTRRVRLDLNGVVREVVTLVTSAALTRGVSLVEDLDPTPPMVDADRVQLQQVVLNLLMNAMEAMADAKEGGRTVTLRSRRLGDGTVQLTVEDTGPGIAPGDATRIFEPFYTTKATGMGMGLSIVRSIVAAHGGRVWATDAPIGGAAVHVALPLAEP